MDSRLDSGRIMLAIVAIIGLVVAMMVVFAGAPALALHVSPVFVEGNPDCDDIGAGFIELKTAVPSTQQYTDGTLIVDVTVSDLTFDWSSNVGVDHVIVKGGPNANVYSYSPEETADNGLHAPLNPQNEKFYGLSHISFCYDVEEEPEPGKIIVKKEVTAGSATDKSFVFTASYDGDGFSLSHGQSNDSGDLTAGTYSVSETVPTGWILQSATCDDQSDPSSISLQEGETVTCTFINHIPDEVSPTSIVSTPTTIPDEVSPTTIVSTTDPEVSPETLPFTGFENGTSGLLALVLVASGALALVGTRVFRKETDE